MLLWKLLSGLDMSAKISDSFYSAPALRALTTISRDSSSSSAGAGDEEEARVWCPVDSVDESFEAACLLGSVSITPLD
jgi:hypothetical protein